MKTRLFLAGIILSLLFEKKGEVFAQYNEWTWMAGDNSTGQPGVYGTQGVSAPTNKPGARYEGGGEWIDLQGNFWHFGGGQTVTNDLWKYDPVTNEWTWMKGSATAGAAGVYGTMGVPNIANTPGARGYGSATCVDLQGNFWLFGGYGTGTHNDLWKYDPVSNMWTWMSGTQLLNQAGTYGTKGVPAAANKPGGRSETDAMWADAAGNIWMFGGIGFLGTFNDLWKFNPATNQWTWMSGSNVINQPGVYGTQGVPAPANVPGARFVYSSWKDLSGNFWIFGGYDGSSIYFDDLWKYDPGTNQWTWMKGTNGAGNISGTYGTKCVDASANNPPAVYENRARWEDDCGNFWEWGGFDANGGVKARNDLWKYTHATGNWTWVSGANTAGQPGVYGAKGVSAPTNIPGARLGNLPFRRPNTNEFWFLGGGLLPNEFNDMWRYVPDKPTASFTFTPNNGCAPATVAFTNTSTPGCNEIKSQAWNFGDPGSGANNTSTLTNPSHIFNTPGTYTVQVVVTNCTGSKDSITQTVTVITCGFTATATPTNISCNGQCTGSAAAAATGGSPAYTYLWNNGQTTQTATGLCTGTFTVTVTDASSSTTTTTVAITQPAAITATISSTPASCGMNNGSAAVTAGGGTPGYTYAWSPSGGSTSAATGLAAGSYTASVTDANGCTQTQTVTITQSTVMAISTAAIPDTCNQSVGTATATVSSGGTSPFTYQWNNGQTTQSASGLSPGNYTVTVTDVSGCTGTSTVVITSTGGPAVVLSSQTNVLCNGGTNGSAAITASGGTSPYTYNWSPSGGTNASASNLSAGTYTVIITDAGGCSSIQTVAITQPVAITATATSLPVCGSNNGSATASAGGGTIPYTYLWSNGGTQSQISNLTSQNYSVTITDASGCTQTTTVNVIVNPNPTATAASNVTITQGQSTTLIASGGGNYSWSNGGTTAAVVVAPAATAFYCVIVTDANGCTDSACVTVFIEPLDCSNAGELYLPNAFSPNNDGENDLLKLYYGNMDCIETYKLVIYNRWGERVFETNDPAGQWNGSHREKDEESAVFVYYLKATLITGEEIMKKGNISLIR